jgi:hypothetical protein
VDRSHDGGMDDVGSAPARLRALIDEFGLRQKDVADECDAAERHVGRALAARGSVSRGFYLRLAAAVSAMLARGRAEAAKDVGLADKVASDPDEFLAALEEFEQRMAVRTRMPAFDLKKAAVERGRRLNDGYRRALALCAELQTPLPVAQVSDAAATADQAQPMSPTTATQGQTHTPTAPLSPTPTPSSPSSGSSIAGGAAWRRWLASSAGAGFRRWGPFGAGVVLAAFVLAWLLARPSPSAALTLQVASATRSHLGVLTGTCPGTEPGHQVRVYVAPDDGSHAYWLQNGPDAVCDPAGRWSAPVRFGNERIDSGQTLPLSFTVFAVLVPPSAAGPLPGTTAAPKATFATDREFEAVLVRLGARQVMSARVVRLPRELCDDLPHLVSPLPGNSPASVGSPVVLSWTPAEPRWIELRKEGQEVPGHSSVTVASGEVIPLPAGLYELKVRPRRDAECSADVWFDVR